MAKVAFIGLGRMGHGMAGHYLDAGFDVAVWNRSKSKAEDLIARGARFAKSPADAADGADAVDLPALDFGIEVLAEHLQPADQGIAGLAIGDL